MEKGADLSAKSADGKTPKDMAVELKSLGAWKRALEEGGMNEDGLKHQNPLNEVCVVAFFLVSSFAHSQSFLSA